MGVVVAGDAGVEPDAVVVGLGDAGPADGAVFAAGWFGEGAGAALVVVGCPRGGVEERVVVGVEGEVLGEVERGDGRGARAGEVDEDVGEEAESGEGEVVVRGGEEGEGGRDEEEFGDGEEEEEEDLRVGAWGVS